MATVLNSGGAAPVPPAPRRILVRAPELVELRALCTAIELGSIGKAARTLQVSQPALSKRLAALEAVAGTQLLERSTRGVRSTPAGERLYCTALRLLRDADSVEELLRGLPEGATPVRLAASPTVAEWWLPQMLVELEASHRHHLSVEVMTANSSAVRALVREGRSDIGIAACSDAGAGEPGLRETVVWEDEIIVAVPPSHRWSAGGDIDPSHFAATPIIRRDPRSSSSRLVDATLARAGLAQVPPVAELGSTAAVRAAALVEGVPVLLSHAAVRDEPEGGLVVRRVAGMRFLRRFAVILAGELPDLAPAARSLAAHLLRDHPGLQLQPA